MPKGDITIKGGALRHLCHILQPTQGPVGTTGSTTVYVPYAQFVPCAIEPASARDIIRGGQTISEVVTPITIRWMPAMVNGQGQLVPISGQFRLQFIEQYQGQNQYSVVSQYVIQGVLDFDQRHWKVTLACLAIGLNQ